MLSVDRPSHLTEQSDPTAATAAGTSAAAAGSSSSSNTKQQLQQLRRTTSSAAAPTGVHPRISDSGSSIAAGGVGGVGAAGGGANTVFGGGLNRAVRARLFGAAGAKKRQVERRAAAANCPALLHSMQPTVEQASMFLFRCALCKVCCAVLGAHSGGLGDLCAAGVWQRAGVECVSEPVECVCDAVACCIAC